jgi:hypothetical protein
MSSGNSAPGSYCYEHTALCVAGGVFLVGITAGIIAGNQHDHSAPPQPSDQRLKRDIKPLMVTDNGIQVYSFRYIGDDRVFTGVIAQDLLADPQLSKAVSTDDDGFYHVDYAKLGLPIVNPEAMEEAGRNAEDIVLTEQAQSNPDPDGKPDVEPAAGDEQVPQ